MQIFYFLSIIGYVFFYCYYLSILLCSKLQMFYYRVKYPMFTCVLETEIMIIVII